MYKDKHILCIIPARGGSKRLPQKNIRLLAGVPLLGYAIRAARASRYIDRTIVSTEDGDIARVAKEQGAEVPFMRPTDLAGDTTPTVPVLQHAVSFFEKKGEYYDLVVLVQPTSPGVLALDIDTAIEKFAESSVNSCVSVREAEPSEAMYRLVDGGRIQGTDTGEGPFYRLNGAVYVTPRAVLMEQGKIYDDENGAAIVMPKERSVDIDTEHDFLLAETLLQRHIKR